jgi:hypothetical protein
MSCSKRTAPPDRARGPDAPRPPRPPPRRDRSGPPRGWARLQRRRSPSSKEGDLPLPSALRWPTTLPATSRVFHHGDWVARPRGPDSRPHALGRPTRGRTNAAEACHINGSACLACRSTFTPVVPGECLSGARPTVVATAHLGQVVHGSPRSSPRTSICASKGERRAGGSRPPRQPGVFLAHAATSSWRSPSRRFWSARPRRSGQSLEDRLSCRGSLLLELERVRSAPIWAVRATVHGGGVLASGNAP